MIYFMGSSKYQIPSSLSICYYYYFLLLQLYVSSIYYYGYISLVFTTINNTGYWIAK